MSFRKMKRFNPYSLIRSFGYAFRGIFYALTRERNLRIHFTAGAFVLFFSRFYPLSGGELGLLILCIGFVITCEMINTAIEKTVDLETMTYNSLAKIAKDVAAGAVLVSAATSLVVGFLLFWDIPTLKLIGFHIITHPFGYFGALAAGLLFITLPQKSR